jgi:hypothetical protein
MKTSKQNPAGQYQSAPAIHTPKLPPTLEQSRKHAHGIYVTRGGATGTTLSDWLKADSNLNGNSEE